MAKNIIQKIRNNYYLYEVEYVWDPATKKSKQKRRSLGRCDENGNLLVKKEDEIVVKDYGEYYILYHIAKKCGIWDTMCKVFGHDAASIYFAYSSSRTLRNCPSLQIEHKIRTSILLELLSIPSDSKYLSVFEYMKLLMGIYDDRNRFFKELARDDKAVVFVLKTFDEPLRFYNLYYENNHHNFNIFPQRSIFLAHGLDRKLPFYLRLSDHPSTDHSSMKRVTSELNGMGVKEVTFYMGPVDISESEVNDYIGIGYYSVISLDTDCGLFTDLQEGLEDVSGFRTVLYRDVVFRYQVYERVFEYNSCKVFVIFNSRVSNECMLSFYKDLDEFESVMSDLIPGSDRQEKMSSDYRYGDLQKFFSITKDEKGRTVLRRNLDLIREAERFMGRSVVITDSDMDIDDILRTMEEMDRYEQDANIFKVDLQEGAGCFPSNEAAVAASMGDFLASIMRTALIRSLKDSGLSEEMYYIEAISTMSRIKAVKMNGQWNLTPLDDFQKRILEKLDIPAPKYPPEE